MRDKPKTAAELRAAHAEDLTGLLRALWFDAHGDWRQAHEIAQEIEDPEGAWVHAYLHRREGDHSNAAYWYRRAHKPVASGSLEQEWEQIAAALLAKR